MKMVEATSDREIVISRVFDAPRELVFDAFTDSKHIGNWWGPAGFTTTTSEMSVKPGGKWVYIMHGPDGRDYPNWIKYIEIIRPEKLVYDHGGDNDTIHFHVTITFAAQGKQTAITMKSIFPTKAARDMVVEKYGAIEGGKQMLVRLAGHLASLAK